MNMCSRELKEKSSPEAHPPHLGKSQTKEEGGTKKLSMLLLDIELTFLILFKDPRETGLISNESSVHVSVTRYNVD